MKLKGEMKASCFLLNSRTKKGKLTLDPSGVSKMGATKLGS